MRQSDVIQMGRIAACGFLGASRTGIRRDHAFFGKLHNRIAFLAAADKADDADLGRCHRVL